MPYKDAEKQREAVRKAVQKHRNTQKPVIPDVIPETVNASEERVSLETGELLSPSGAPESMLGVINVQLQRQGLPKTRRGIEPLLRFDKKLQTGKGRM